MKNLLKKIEILLNVEIGTVQNQVLRMVGRFCYAYRYSTYQMRCSQVVRVS
jgi:hypothetical protein